MFARWWQKRPKNPIKCGYSLSKCHSGLTPFFFLIRFHGRCSRTQSQRQAAQDGAGHGTHRFKLRVHTFFYFLIRSYFLCQFRAGRISDPALADAKLCARLYRLAGSCPPTFGKQFRYGYVAKPEAILIRQGIIPEGRADAYELELFGRDDSADVRSVLP